MVSSSLFFLLTRGALLAFLMLGILIVSFVIYNQQNHIKYKSKIIGLLVAISIGYFISNSVMSNDDSSNLVAERVASISVNTEDESIGQRLRYYKLSTQIIGKNFLTGIGIGNWKFQSIAYDASNIREYTVPYHAHNDFLQVASEVGIFGLLAYMCVFLIPILGSIKHIFTAKNKLIGVCLLGALSVYLIDSMLNFPISRPISHVYFLFILAAYQNLSNQDENNS
jgi:O-antigen ligase